MPQYVALPDLPIRITARGEWQHGGQALHPRVAELFAKNLQPKVPDHYSIVLGPARQVIEVEDTAYFVRRMETHCAPGDAARLLQVRLSLSDRLQEDLQPQTLMQSAERVLYCRVVRQGLSVPVRFAAQHYHSLMLFAQARADPLAPDGQRGHLVIDGQSVAVGDYDPRIFAV